MQFAVTVSPSGTQIIQVGKDAPRYAQCVYCGMPVMLSNSMYIHSVLIGKYHCYSRLKDTECQKLRDSGQAELDEVLGVR